MTSVEQLDNITGMEKPGDRLRKTRIQRGLSVEELSLRLGRSASGIRHHENGTLDLNVKAANDYARALGTSPAYLLFGDAESADPAPPTNQLPLPTPATDIDRQIMEAWQQLRPADKMYFLGAITERARSQKRRKP